MPIKNIYLEETDVFVNEYKSRSKTKAFKTGHTYRNLKTKDFHLFNSRNMVKENISLLLTKDDRTDFENGVELILSKKLKGESNRNNSNDSGVLFSMDKKKRWLLPDLLKIKANDLKNESNVINNAKNKKDSEDKLKYGLAVYSIEKSILCRGGGKVFNYFDSAGNQFDDVQIDFRSIDSQIHGERSWRALRRAERRNRNQRRFINPVLTKKRSFKNGNRNRNSGIKRANETFINERLNNVERQNNFQDLGIVKYDFYYTMAKRQYETLKSWRSGLKYYPGRYGDYNHYERHEYRYMKNLKKKKRDEIKQ